ncbi:hypothetical protein ACFSCX_25135 [Bacillus salitolerans]|uniref:Uncharacterized protein n=1 Tax=Bacillus salitolerans TaxID=1437434 RepID=A0ABW4LX61_9BACI
MEFSNWTQVFGDEQMTAALVDRLTPPIPYSCNEW